MLYRLFHPETKGKLPLVVYLHGSGGQGTDNLKQLALGNIFGTRVWLLPKMKKHSHATFSLRKAIADGSVTIPRNSKKANSKWSPAKAKVLAWF